MRGSPLLRLGIILAAFGLLLFPLGHLTARREAAPAPVAANATAASRVELELTATAGPTDFRVTHLGADVWRGRVDAGGTARGEAELAFPPEGIDLVLEATWPGGSTGAVRLEVARDAAAGESQTAWGAGSIDEALTYRGAP